MNGLPLDLATAVVLQWVRLYTAGALASARDRRRAEIESDLWEHQSYASWAGESPGETSRQILGRFVRGIPADLAWRLQLKGEPTMLSKMVIERSTGALMVLVVASLLGGFTVGRFGIGAETEYFRDDFPKVAANPESLATGLVLMSLVSLLTIVSAAALYLTFRPHEPALATFGSFGLLAAGILLLVDSAAGRALHSLASEWRATGGIPGDQIWSAARAVALVFEYLSLVSFTLILASLLAFGGLILRNGSMPRWVGGLAVAGGACTVIGIALMWIVHSEGFWALMMVGWLLGMVWFLVAGVLLLLRGTADIPPPSAA